ncbi:hypothetical protein [Actinoplanes sp. URMC 104]|uniref:hypothetical protein n=1 Tax=Actinoplanes sp. URMC 104 TaxID=3423409 RepID=UPI003F1CFF12
MTRRTSTVLLTALVAAGLASCDPGGSAASTSPSATASASRQQLLALGQEWVTCLRDRGLTRMPDAELSQDGYLQFSARAGYDWKKDLGNHPDIIEACKPIEDRYPPTAFRPKEQYSAEDLRKLAAYAECVRQHGIPDFPDPDAQGRFDVSGTPLANGIPGRLQDQADAACRHIWSGGIKIDGGTGGKK